MFDCCNLNHTSSNTTYFSLVIYLIFICLGQILQICPLIQLEFLAVLLCCWFCHSEVYLFQLHLALWKLRLLLIFTALCALVSWTDDPNLSWKMMGSAYDSAERPGKHFSSCYALAISSQGVSVPVSQVRSFHCSFYFFITTLYFSITTISCY